MADASHLATGEGAGPTTRAAELARLIREYGFAGASFFVHPAGGPIR